ncbi:MAG: DUF87 domain-containing protein, partial [Sphingomonas sp.]
MNDMTGTFRGIQAFAPIPVAPIIRTIDIGAVLGIAGSASEVALAAPLLNALGEDDDPAIACAGQVGSQIKIRLGSRWLIANIRELRLSASDDDTIIASVDFLGEGDEARIDGRMVNFRRGVTRYPLPGARVYPVSTEDMRQMYAADDRPNIQVGMVYPTSDIRGALYVDAMLGKHFALLGSTGTGKSTSAALILHRICQVAPEGHIVMVDPHGEYSAAFKGTGEIFDVGNLAMPYWLMNFEEHCEVFVTTEGAERQMDSDILGKALLAARAK